MHLLNTSRDGDSTTYLGSLFQFLTALSVNKFFLISNLNLPWCNLRLFPLSYHLLIGRRDQVVVESDDKILICILITGQEGTPCPGQL